MSRRYLCHFAAMFLLGVGWSVYHMRLCLWGGVFLAALLLRPYLRCKRTRQKTGAALALCLVAAGFLLGAWRGGEALRQEKEADVFFAGAPPVSFCGDIAKTEQKNERTIYYLQRVTLQKDGKALKGRSVILTSVSEEFPIGTTVSGRGTYLAFRTARNEGGFDERSYYRGLGIAARLNVEELSVIRTPAFSFGGALETLRQGVAAFYAQALPAEESGVLSAIALGMRSLLDPQVKTLYQLSGLSHILAVSGLHISVVGMGLYRFFRRRGCGTGISCGVSFAVLFSYALLCGMSSSTKRAVVMFAFVLAADLLGRTADTFTSLAVAAFLLVWQEPFLPGQSAFVFSFGAVAGMAGVCRKMGKIPKSRIGRSLWQAVLIQLWMLPFVAYFSYEAPLYAMFLNLFLLPLLPAVLGFGLCGGLTGLLFPGAGRLLLIPCHLFLYLYEAAADRTLALPGSRQIIGSPKHRQILLYLFCFFLLAYGARNRRRDANRRRRAWERPRGRSVFARSGLIRILPVFFLPLLLLPHPPRETEITFLDVGQGDGIFLQSGRTACFVDGGSSTEEDVGTYRILPFLKYRGIRHMDYWFVSHTDEDHISGLREALCSGYEIRCLVLPAAAAGGDDPTLEELLKEAEARGVKVHFMERGERIRSGRLCLTCWYPPADGAFEGKNENSLVLLAESGNVQCLLTGDISEEQERWLCEHGLPEKEEGQYRILKAAHHGSRYASSAAFLELFAPDCAVISVGEGNTYGHPAEETLLRLEEAGAEVRLTRDEGQLTFSGGGPPRGFCGL